MSQRIIRWQGMRALGWARAGVAVLIFPASGMGQDSGVPAALRADLTGDGQEERITWVKFAETEEEGEFYQVRVLDQAGRLLWEGPKEADSENPLVFGNWHFGYSLPELVADIDGDGTVEMVTPAPQSDVSPTWFRVLSWKGGRFVPGQMGALLESPRGSGRFAWHRGEEWQGTWIAAFEDKAPRGALRVKIWQYSDGAEVMEGQALVTPAPDGYQVREWLAPLRPLGNAPPGEPAMPGGGVIYRTRLSQPDHFNSAGARLETVGDILRQDRARFHNGQGDPEDGPDPLFGSRAAREGMDRRRAVPVGSEEGAWRRAIVNGTPLVEVEVTDAALKVRILEP